MRSVPGDLSSAAFFLCAAALFPESNLVLDGIGMNPTRASLLDVLRALGVGLNVLELSEQHAELVGTLQVVGNPNGLVGAEISGALSAQLIDELPVLAAIAPYTRDGIRIRDARELRVKESDRIALVAKNLRAMGAEGGGIRGRSGCGRRTNAAWRGNRCRRRSSHCDGVRCGGIARERADSRFTEPSRPQFHFLSFSIFWIASPSDRRAACAQQTRPDRNDLAFFHVLDGAEAYKPCGAGRRRCRGYGIVTILALVGMERFRLGFRLGRFAGREHWVPGRHFRWLHR